MARHSVLLIIVFMFIFIGLSPQPAQAYIGPGTGMSAVGVFLAVLMGFIFAVIGFVWYPAKRLLHACRKRFAAEKGETPR